MGRRPIGEHAMTAAERQRRRRAKAKAFRDTDPVTKPAEAIRDTEAVTKLEQALAAARAEIEALRRENELLRRALLVFPANPDKGKLRPAGAKLILRCLHPDNSASAQMRHDAFIAFKAFWDTETRSAQQAAAREAARRQRSERAKAARAKRRAAREASAGP